MLGPKTSLNKSPVHGVAHKAHRLQKGPQRRSLSPLMGSERLSFPKEDAHQRRGQERQLAVREVPTHISCFWCISRTENSWYFVFLNGFSVRLNYWSHVYHCHCRKADPGDVCFTVSNFEQRFSAFKGWHCMSCSLGLALPFFLPSSVPASILCFFTLPNISKENARGGKNWTYHFHQQWIIRGFPRFCRRDNWTKLHRSYLFFPLSQCLALYPQ